MNNPKVSIIIPVYNGEKYVEKAIRSALQQTYDNIEILVVNDGSTDRTDEVCRKYKDEEKIRYYKKENGGVSTALNLALEKMTGEYFSWLSHDDYYYPNKIEEDLKAIEEKTIVLSDYGLIDENGHCYNKVIQPHEVINMHNEFALFKGYINGITLLIPRNAFIECGNFDVSLRCTQDYDMWLRMLLKGYKFKHIPKVLALTRIHSNQVTNTNPKMVSEGNELWIRMMEELPLERKKMINNTEYNFYKQMVNVLKDTPYDGAMLYAENKEKEMCKNKLKQNEDILISVIMPFYDEKEEILRKSINSVLKQTHKNFELIIINDNPGVRDSAFISNISIDNRIVYVENEKNMGASYSRNRGIDIARGKYIAFLDGDDEFRDRKLEIQINELEMCAENFSHTSYTRCCGNEKININSGKLTDFIYRQCIYNCPIATPTVMIRKEFLNFYNIRFNEKIHIGEDTCFWLDILTRTCAVGIEDALTMVNINEDSAAYNRKKNIEGIKNIINYISKNENLMHYEEEVSIIKNTYQNLINNDYNMAINNPKVSIIIPVYNGENYIQLAIDSAIRQSYSNIEIIVVDDGSNDKTKKICKRYGNKIKYIEKKNGGVSTALNVGIRNMTGDYFSWLSHDDLYFPEKIFEEVRYLQKNRLIGTRTIVYSDYTTINEKGELINHIKLDSTKLNYDGAFAMTTGALNGLSLLVPKEAFEEAGLFDEKNRCLQDYDLWFKMYKCGYKFTHLSKILVATRLHKKQVTNTNPNMKIEGNKFWKSVINFFPDNEKIRLYGSIYNYYYSLYKTFNGGIYDEVIELCREKYLSYENRVQEKVKNTKVSIIFQIPGDDYNYIESLESILSQSHRNIEIILINNGCTINIDKIKLYIEKNKSIMYKEYKEKRDNIEIWNDAIKLARGEFIVIFNKNSIMDDSRVEVQLTKMIADESVISHMSYYLNSNNQSKLVNVYYLDGNVTEKIIDRCDINLATVMFSKKYLLEHDLFFKKIGNLPATWLFYIDILKDNRILAIDDKVLTTVYEYESELDTKIKDINSIVNYVTDNKELRECDEALIKLLYNYEELIKIKVDDFSDVSKHCHDEELARYAYMLTSEYKEVTKIRKTISRIRLKSVRPSYEIDNNYIVNSGLNKFYRKIRRRKI